MNTCEVLKIQYAKHYESGDPKPGIVDLFYLRSPDEKRAVGVLANRTYNFYTQWNVANCGAFVWSGDDDDWDLIPDMQENFELTNDGINITWNDFAYNTARTAYYINENIGVKVKKLKTYIVTYIDPFTLQVVGTQNKYNAFGKLNLDFPYLTGTKARPILLYKVEPKNDKNYCTSDSSKQEENQSAFELLKYKIPIPNIETTRIFPNPAEDFVQIEWPSSSSQCIVELITCTGYTVKFNEFRGYSGCLNLNDVQSGVYILRVHYDQNIETFKLIVQ